MQAAKETQYVIFCSLAIKVVFPQLKTHDFASPRFDGFAIYSLAQGYSFQPYNFENIGFIHLLAVRPG
jgi:hypothetical protein